MSLLNSIQMDRCAPFPFASSSNAHQIEQLASIADYVTAPSSDSGETAPVLDTSVAGCTNDIIAYAGYVMNGEKTTSGEKKRKRER